MANVEPIPDGYPQVTPYLVVDDAASAIDFYEHVLGARERMRLPGPDGKVGHSELVIGDGLVMVADEIPGMHQRAPRSLGGTPVTINVYVNDVDAVYDRAIQAGARPISPVEDMFYGDRAGQFEDPFGHRWSVATHVEDVPPDEMERRVQEMMGR